MEEKTYNIYQVNEKKLIEINRVDVDGKTYAMLVDNSEPYPVYVAEIADNNTIEFIKEKPLAIKLLKEISKDKTTYEKFKLLVANNK